MSSLQIHFSMIMTKIVRHFFVVECEGGCKEINNSNSESRCFGVYDART